MMKNKSICSFALLVFFFVLYTASCANATEYKVQLGSDGSAILEIIHAAESSFSYNTIQNFTANFTTLVERAEEMCGRKMDAVIDEINIIPQNSYVLVKFRLYWKNFSKIEDSKIIAGDVFQVESFFSYLLGDGALSLIYPQEYVIASATPNPDEIDDSLKILKWLSAEGFSSQHPSITLTIKSASNVFLEFFITFVPIAFLGLALFFAFYMYNRRRGARKAPIPSFYAHPDVKNSQGEIIRTLKAAGGRLYQSQIVEKCGFSKAKTSQLLKTLEKSGVIRRQKMGRDKLVILAEEKNGEKP
ncbi:MAG: MarR family transcriptional regulator [Candidatus Bathyarchaeia archaeon]